LNKLRRVSLIARGGMELTRSSVANGMGLFA